MTCWLIFYQNVCRKWMYLESLSDFILYMYIHVFLVGVVDKPLV